MISKSVLQSKLHHVRVTHALLNYEGSCAIDAKLLEAAGILEFEQLHIWNITNGARFVTYAIQAEQDTGIISLNGGAARHAQVGDFLVIASFITIAAADALNYKPKLIFVNHDNTIKDVRDFVPQQVYAAY